MQFCEFFYLISIINQIIGYSHSLNLSLSVISSILEKKLNIPSAVPIYTPKSIIQAALTLQYVYYNEKKRVNCILRDTLIRGNCPCEIQTII